MNDDVPLRTSNQRHSKRSRTPVWCEFVCACCAKSTAGRFLWGQINRGVMKSEAAREGWIFEHDETFCSNACRLQWLKKKDKAA